MRTAETVLGIIHEATLGTGNVRQTAQDVSGMQEMPRRYSRWKAGQTCRHEQGNTGEPGTVKAVSPVRRGADRKVPATVTRWPPTLLFYYYRLLERLAGTGGQAHSG